MILLYEFGNDERAETIRRFLTDKGFEFRDVGQDLIHEPVQTLLQGQGSPQDNPNARKESGIVFSEDIDHEEAVRLLAAFERIEVFFTYKIQAEESNIDQPLEAVFQAQLDNEAFIDAIRDLKDLVEATAQLSQEDYDPDLWSDLKFAVADANDFFDALVANEKDASDNSVLPEVEKLSNGLREALDKLLG